MLANALRTGRNLRAKLNLSSRSRRVKLAVTTGIVLVVGPSFFGVVASSYRPTDRALTKQARPRLQPRLADHPAPPVAILAPRNLTSTQARGVAILPALEAGERFHASLTPAEQARSTFPTDEAAWLDLMQGPSESRGGATFAAMTTDQRTAALELIETTLTLPGLNTDHAIDHLRAALTPPTTDPNAHRFTLLGRPGADAAWGWQIDTPHLVVTCFAAGDLVVVTPTARPESTQQLAAVAPSARP